MILVVGSTGLLGREICGKLLDRGKQVRALVRKTSNHDVVKTLKSLGAEIAAADLKDRPSLDAVCRHVKTVISTAASTLSRQQGDSIDSVDRQGQINLIDAARKAGVRRFIFISFSHEKAAPCALKEAKSVAEQHLIKSGMEYTIIRPSFFMEVWLSPALGFDQANAKATVYGSGKNPISWISLFDVASFAVETVDNPAARNRVMEIGGPEAISPLEVVSIFEETTGRRFEIQHVPEEALQAQRAAATDPLQHSFATLMLFSAKGDAVDMSEMLREFPVRVRSVRDYAQGFKAGR
jgi:uncharacterized protein YbjT (DUF2867 family)